MQWRGATTNQLGDVIQTLQLVRKSGTLHVERGEEAMGLEQGTITLVDGQIMEAHCGGQLSGPTALNVMLNWKPCRFSFVPLGAQSPSLTPPSFATPRVQQSLPTPIPPTPPAPRISNTPNTPAYPSYTSSPVPFRLRTAEESLKYIASSGLTRTHRHLFLLIDGRHSVNDLIQILGRRPEEVYTLLSELERAGLIKQR
jgi:hypothetical protein